MQPVGASNVLRTNEVNLMLLRSSLILVTICLLPQFHTAQAQSPTPPNFKLLPGYTWTETTGKDARTARMVRSDGFTITHVSPAVKGFYERSFGHEKDVVWLKNQTINGNRIAVASMRNNEILAVVDDTYMFRAKPEKLDQLVDLLITVGTFLPKTTQSSSAIPTAIEPPGHIRLLAGYKYVRRRGVDSHVGSIIGDTGLTIDHDIGGMASNYSREYFPDHFEKLRKQTHLNKDAIESHIRYLQQQVSWQIRQEVNGEYLMIVYFKDAKLIASFDRSTANFIARVDSFDQMTDFLLTVLTYQPKPSSKLPK